MVEYASLYIRIAWFGHFPASICLVCRGYLQNQNIAMPVTWASLFGVFVNLFALTYCEKYLSLG